jgi:GNAT superfamily N-acetyltransferase
MSICQIETPDDIDAVRGLVREFFAYAETLDPDAKSASTFGGLEAELAALPGGPYGPPDGCFLLARVDGAAAGCVALRRTDATLAEVKRMFVRPSFRGQKIGQRLVTALLTKARDLGYLHVELSSFYTMTSAHAIYRAAGFRDVPQPPGFPKEYEDRVVFMEMDLT